MISVKRYKEIFVNIMKEKVVNLYFGECGKEVCVIFYVIIIDLLEILIEILLYCLCEFNVSGWFVIW